MTMSLSRRQTLGLTIGGIAAVVAIGATVGGVTMGLRNAVTDRLSERLLQMLPDRRGAVRIGATWLQRHPEFAATTHALPDRLAARLKSYGWTEDDVRTRAGSAGDAPAEGGLRNTVATIVRDEFLHGQIEDIHGWRISNFQAELCGLACLVESRPKLS